MATELLTLRPTDDIYDAIDALLDRKFSGAPVIDSDRQLVGILSEKDCLRTLANDTLYGLPAGRVEDYMTRDVKTIEPTADIYGIASLFMNAPYRRLPVVDGDDKLVGQVSRRDVLRGIQRMKKPANQYPDYRRPT